MLLSLLLSSLPGPLTQQLALGPQNLLPKVKPLFDYLRLLQETTHLSEPHPIDFRHLAMSSMNPSGEASPSEEVSPSGEASQSVEAGPSNQNKSLEPVCNNPPAYNLDDFAFPTFVPKALEIENLTSDVRTWRELIDYVKANSRILSSTLLKRTLILQADYAKAGPTQRTNIPAMTPIINHASVRGGKGKGRGGTTHHGAHAATPTKTNINVPGAAQSQGLAKIAIGPREFPSDVCRKEVMQANVSGPSGTPRELPPGKEAVPTKESAAPGAPRKLSSQSCWEAIPVKSSAVPVMASKQTAVKTATEATPGQAKPATANTTKGAPQGMQKQTTTNIAKGYPSLKSASVNLKTKESAKTLKSAQKDHEVGKMTPTLMGELVDLSVPPGTKSLLTLPQMLHHGIRPINSYTKPAHNPQMMPALAAIPALIPAKISGHHPSPTGSGKEPQPPNPAPAKQPPHMQILSRAVMPPPPTRTISRHSSSTRSRSPSLYSRSPSPEKPKTAAEPPKTAQPKQAGRHYLVWVKGKPDYVWVAGAQRGDPCPSHLVPVEYGS